MFASKEWVKDLLTKVLKKNNEKINNSLTDKILFNNGGSDADVLNNGISCYIVPYSTSWKYANIEHAWYMVISICFASNHYQQYWLGLTSTHVYQRITTNSGSTWTVTEMH